MAKKDDMWDVTPGDIDSPEYERREKDRVRERKRTISDGVASVLMALYLGHSPSITPAVTRELKGLGGKGKLAVKNALGSWVLTPLGHDIAQGRLSAAQAGLVIKAEPLPDDPVLTRARFRGKKAPPPQPPKRGGGPRKGPPPKGRPTPPVRGTASTAQSRGAAAGVDPAEISRLIREAVASGIEEGIRSAMDLMAPATGVGRVPNKGPGPVKRQPPAPTRAPAPMPPAETKGTRVKKKGPLAPGESGGVTPDLLMGGFPSLIGSIATKGRRLLRKARQLTLGEKEAKAEEEEIRKGVVGMGKAAKTAMSIVTQNMATLAEKAPEVIEKAEAFQKRGVQETLGKIESGREIFPEDAKPLLKAFTELAESLEDSGLALEASVDKLVRGRMEVLADPKATLDEKRTSLEGIERLVKQSGLQTAGVKELKAVLDEGFNDLDGQNERARKALETIALDAEEQKVILSSTYDDMTHLLEDQLLSSRRLEKLGARQLEDGETFWDRFKEQGLGAIQGTAKRGALDTGLSALGLGGVSNLVEELWDLKDLFGKNDLAFKAASGVANVARKAGAGIAKKVRPYALAGALNMSDPDPVRAEKAPEEVARPKAAGGMIYRAAGGMIGRGLAGLGKAALNFNPGPVTSPRGTDSVNVMASPGEYMVSEKGVKGAGIDELEAINKGQSGTLSKILDQVTQMTTVLRQFRRESSGSLAQTVTGQAKLVSLAKTQADKTGEVVEKIEKIKPGSGGGILDTLGGAGGGLLSKAGGLLKGAGSAAMRFGPMAYLASAAGGGAHEAYRSFTEKDYDKNFNQETEGYGTADWLMHPGKATMAIGKGLTEGIKGITGLSGGDEYRDNKLRDQELFNSQVKELMKKGKTDQAQKLLEMRAPKDGKATLNRVQEGMRNLFGEKGILTQTADVLTDGYQKTKDFLDPENLKKGMEGLVSWATDFVTNGANLLRKAGESVPGGKAFFKGVDSVVGGVKSIAGKAASALGMGGSVVPSKGDQDRLAQIKDTTPEDTAQFAKLGAEGKIKPPSPNDITVTSPIGVRDIAKGSHVHQGIDIRAGDGSPIQASMAGTVADVKDGPDPYKNIVSITGEGGITTQYRHLSPMVKVGDQVTAGQQIGTVNTRKADGTFEFPPHQHFEVKKDGKFVDPAKFLSAGGVPLAGKTEARLPGRSGPLQSVPGDMKAPAVQKATASAEAVAMDTGADRLGREDAAASRAVMREAVGAPRAPVVISAPAPPAPGQGARIAARRTQIDDHSLALIQIMD